jgi:hypothetical protein
MNPWEHVSAEERSLVCAVFVVIISLTSKAKTYGEIKISRRNDEQQNRKKEPPAMVKSYLSHLRKRV